MKTRKVKEAKDLASNELIYFRGHAKATYMSDGKTVEEAVNGKQETLVSGENIKTINGEPILGKGNIVTGGGGVTEEYVNTAITKAITITLNTEV